MTAPPSPSDSSFLRIIVSSGVATIRPGRKTKGVNVDNYFLRFPPPLYNITPGHADVHVGGERVVWTVGLSKIFKDSVLSVDPRLYHVQARGPADVCRRLGPAITLIVNISSRMSFLSLFFELGGFVIPSC